MGLPRASTVAVTVRWNYAEEIGGETEFEADLILILSETI